MKKTILYLCILSLTFQWATAQVNLTLSPNPATARGNINLNDPGFELVAAATLTNEGSEAVSIVWERFTMDMPEGWDVQVCDLNFCYEPFIYSNVSPEFNLNAPVTLTPGDTTNLDVHIKPNGVSGSTEVRVDVTLVGAPDEVVLSGIYNFNALLTSSQDISRARLAIFPNPTTDFFELRGAAGIDRVVLYNIVGQNARSFNVASNKRYYVGDLPNGLYLASLVSKKDGVVKTFRLSKRSIQP